MGTALAVLKFMPLILSAVLAVEQQLGAGQGVTKKAVVMAAIHAATAAGEQMDDLHVAAISKAVDLVVGSLNMGGHFKPSDTRAAVPAVP